MSIIITGSAYDGEVLEQLLVQATTTNELVDRGLIRLVPNVTKKTALPRMKTGKMLQKVKEMPGVEDGKGNFTYDEKYLEPKQFMAFTTFNPAAFEAVWRPFQPKGNLVFEELPTSVQNTLLAEMAAAVNFELGGHFINGEFGDDDDHLFNGVITKILADADIAQVANAVALTKENIIAKMNLAWEALPIKYRAKAKMAMSPTDFTKYSDALTDLSAKGPDYTTQAAPKFKNMPIEVLSEWPEHVIICTIWGSDAKTNVWGGVNLVNDFDTIKIGLLQNAGELYFFKMKMSADTEIAWGEQCSVYDGRA